ncbi:MAG: hypothetical protein V4550_18225 [Gemmatimonadota bacterium]
MIWFFIAILVIGCYGVYTYYHNRRLKERVLIHLAGANEPVYGLQLVKSGIGRRGTINGMLTSLEMVPLGSSKVADALDRIADGADDDLPDLPAPKARRRRK